MSKKIEGSIVAEGGSKISNAKNTQIINKNKIYRDAAIISFIVGVVSSIVANLIWEYWIR